PFSSSLISGLSWSIWMIRLISSHLGLQKLRAEALKEYLVQVAKLKPNRVKVAEAILQELRKSEGENAADEMRENEGLILKILN
ncbi:MAG: hypothetical protein AAFU64_11615, partial [Bacteroidota bacterium]